MNFEYLNKMVQYIENNLVEDINYNELSKIVGVSEYSLQRIFMFLTNISLAEYIRKRRLSKAFEELKNTDIKIIDLAIKYKYDSPISFDRAFKNMFGVTPTQCRNTSENYKVFPIIQFNSNNETYEEISYEIKYLEDTTIYAVSTQAKTNEDLLFYIRKLYSKIKKNRLHKKFNEIGMYGISEYKENTYYYYVGSKEKYNGTKKVIIPKGKYAIFNVGSREQKDIVKTENYIFSKWLPSTNYIVEDDFSMELYVQDNCFIYIPVKDKQN